MRTLLCFLVVGLISMPSLVAKEYSIDSVLRHAKNDKIVVVETKAGKRLWLLVNDEKDRERSVDFLQRRIGGKIKVTDKNARRVVKAKFVEIYDEDSDHIGNLEVIAKNGPPKSGVKNLMSIFKKDQ